MSISVMVFESEEENETFEVATNLGWAQFVEFVQSNLDMESHSELYQLAEHGLTEDTEKAAAQLSDAIENHDPDESVSGICESLLDILESAAPGEVAVVTNGIAY